MIRSRGKSLSLCHNSHTTTAWLHKPTYMRGEKRKKEKAKIVRYNEPQHSVQTEPGLKFHSSSHFSQPRIHLPFAPARHMTNGRIVDVVDEKCNTVKIG
jgi:hypothetical protein